MTLSLRPRQAGGLVVLVSVLTLALHSPVLHAQGATDDADREVIVEFAPGTISLPVGRTTSAINALQTLPSGLQSTLQLFDVRELRRAFPDAPAKAVVARSFVTGDDVKLPDLSGVYVLRAASPDAAAALAKALKPSPTPVRANPPLVLGGSQEGGVDPGR